MKKTIWIPGVIGIVSGSLILSAALADFFIPLGNETSMGVGEIFATLSAALGGPMAVLLTLLIPYISVTILQPELFTEARDVYIILADAAAHMFAMLVVAIFYYRFLHPRAKKTRFFLIGWWLTVGIYYYVVFLPMEVLLLNLADPAFGATYPTFARNFIPEFIGTALITSLVWFAAPAHYRRPRWIEPKNAAD